MNLITVLERDDKNGRVTIDVNEGYFLVFQKEHINKKLYARRISSYTANPYALKPSKDDFKKAAQIAYAIFREKEKCDKAFAECMDFFENPEEAIAREDVLSHVSV